MQERNVFERVSLGARNPRFTDETILFEHLASVVEGDDGVRDFLWEM